MNCHPFIVNDELTKWETFHGEIKYWKIFPFGKASALRCLGAANELTSSEIYEVLGSHLQAIEKEILGESIT